MTDAVELKNEIDKNQNGIEAKEIEEFLQSEENIKKLGEALNSNIDSTLLDEFHTAISELCDKMPKIEKCTLNQYKIILFYLNNFEPIKPILNPNDKLVKIYNKVMKNWENAMNDYFNQLKKKPFYDIKGPIAELRREETDITRILQKGREGVNKTTEELKAKGEFDPGKRSREIINGPMKEKEKKAWEADKQKIQAILDKEGTFTEDEKNELLKFKSRYYFYHENYDNPQDLTLRTSISMISSFRPSEEYDEIAAKIDKKINAGSFNYINDIISKEEIPQKIDIKGLGTINQWVKEFGNTTSENREIKKKIEGIILKKVENISKTFTEKDVDKVKLDKTQIGIFQLRANVEYGEDLQINGIKSALNSKTSTVTEGEITALYIYRKRLSIRDSKNYENILKIPDIDNLLYRLGSKEKEHIVFKDFIIYLSNIQKSGIRFENKIGSNVFESLLLNMISSEFYRGTTASSELQKWEFIKRYAEENTELYNQCEQVINLLKQLKGDQDYGEYYKQIYNQQKNAINRQLTILKEEERIAIENQRRENYNKEINKFLKSINNLPKFRPPLDQEKFQKDYKDAYEKVAKEFIKIWRNKEYKKYLKDKPICSQIFIEIYCLYKDDNISKKFGADVRKECKKCKSYLDSLPEVEEIVDTYYQVNEANKNIEKGKGTWGERHYDTEISLDHYVNAVDSPAKTQSETTQRHHEITKTRYHYDEYHGNRYHEEHRTVVHRTEIKDGKKTSVNYHGYGTPSYNPNATLVFPRGWYAILPDNLKEKSNQGKIKLAIINGDACAYEFTEGTDIKLWKYDIKKGKLVFSKKITVEQYSKALTIESERSKLWEAEYGEEYERIQQELNTVFDKYNGIQSLFNERLKGDLDGIEYNDLLTGSIQLNNMVEDLASKTTKLNELKTALKKLQNSNNYENPYEKEIKERIENIDKIISIISNKTWIDQNKQFKELCLSGEIKENDNWYDKTRQERLTLTVTFIVAVAATVFAISTLGLGSPTAALSRSTFGAYLTVGAISTGTALVAREGMGRALDGTSNGSFTVDGNEYHVMYKNPSLIKQAMDPNSTVTRKDCVLSYGTEFLTGTILQALLMQGGAIVSNYIGNLINKAAPGSFTRKAADLVCSRLCKESVKGDAFTEGLIKSVEKQVTKEGFMKQFSKELIEETREEGVEQAAESQGKILGVIATIIHCIKPHPSIQAAGIGHPKIDVPEGQGKLIAQTTYDGTNPDNINILKKYYENIKGYSVSIEEGGILKVTAEGVTTGKGETLIQKDVELEFRPSKAPLAIRNMPTELNNLGSIITNDETGEVGYGSKVQLRALGAYLEDQGLGSVVINKDGTATLTIGKEKINLIKDESYIDGKSHMYNISPEQVYSNSEYMDQISYEIGFDVNGENLGKILENLLGKINERYKEATQLNEGLNLSKEQLLSIIEAHKQDGKLGNLNPAELTNKYNILYNAKIEKDTIRFLFEAGFCGSLKLGTDNIGDIKRLNQQEIQQLIDGKSELKIEEMTLNDLNVLMWKAANMGLNTDTIRNVMKKIGERIKNIKEGGNYNKEHMEQLEENIAQISFEVEIKGIEINDPDFDAKINEIEGEINNRFGESKTGKELKVELDKKKFEYYKVNGESLKANLTVNEMESLNKSLLSEDITNFKYKRGLLDVELYKIQLGIGNIETMKKNAEELREDSDCIGGRTDINTLLSKIEAGILLGKPQKQLDAYLSYLAIQEHEVGVNILGNVFGTISNTFPEQELDASAERMENAGKASENSDLKNKGERARKIAEDYKETKKKLEGDKNDVEKKKLQDIIDESVYLTPIKSITDIGNTFINPLQLFNYGTVASVEITENTYSKTHEILTGNKEVNGVKIEGGIDMEGNRDPSKSGFREYMKNLNEKFDGFIRTLYSTQKLQELNSASHSSSYDANMKSYLEQVGLNDLAQIMEIYGIADCRVHAFTKQILFDTMKRTQLQNLNKKLNDPNTSKEDKQRIEKQIKILKNTKMVYIDATLTGNVRMRGKYVKEGDGHFVEGNENAIIEEHTYNLLEIPTIDSEGNITYNKGEMAREVYYADSFYQGHMVEIIDKDGNTIEGNSVYDLSYNGETDIGETIYGRTYYSKKNGKYVNDPKINMSMSTEVITPDGKVLPITSVPLFRSVQGRGNNLTPSNVEPEVLKPDEVKKRNSETEAHVEAIDKLNTARSEISHTMKEALKNGEIEKLEDMLNNGIGTAMHFNVETGTRETGSRLIIINETQAKFLKRAIDICKNYNGNIPINMQESLNTMFDHIVTEEEVDYRKKSGENSDVEERMGIFWDNIQVFNEVYKSRVEDAMKNLNPNDEASIQRLENAIKDFKKIYDEDMKEFHKRNQDMMLKENKKNETYHRNNFEHVAKRFKSDCDTYISALKKYEELGIHKQAFELRQQIKIQYNELLLNSQELLSHFIDSDLIKSELKGPLGREIYAKLISIQNRLEKGESVNFNEEFGEDSNKIKDLLGIESWSKDTIDASIKEMQKSGLADYYTMISLVHNSQIEQILMENAVYGSKEKGYYQAQENGYVSESYESYEQRMIQNKTFEEGLKKGEKSLGDIEGHLRGLIETNEVLDDTSKKQINNLISTMISEFGDMFPSDLEAYKFFKAATEVLIFQTMESDTRSMGDHGINHISGNIAKLCNYLESESNAGFLEGDLKQWKFMGYVTHIFHDKGYSALVAQGPNHRKGTDLHPFTSKMYFNEVVKTLLDKVGIYEEGNNGEKVLKKSIDTELISQAVEAHDGINLDFTSNENIFLSWVNISDNMALGLDKVPLLQRHPKLLRRRAILYKMSKSGLNLKGEELEGGGKEEGVLEKLSREIDESEDLNPSEKEALKGALTELSRRSFENVDFLSIHPIGDAEIKDGVRVIKMYKADTFLLSAQMCGIDPETLNNAIKNAKETGDTTELEKLIGNDKFGNQIIKPLKDYQDKYIIANQEGFEYPKIGGKYNRNKISADLLIGKTVKIQEGTKTKVEFVFKENGEIPKNLKDGGLNLSEEQSEISKGIEHRQDLEVDETLENLGKLNSSLEKMKETVEDGESISEEEYDDFRKSLQKLNDIEIASKVDEFNEKIKAITEASENLENTLKNNNPKDIENEIKAILGLIRTSLPALI